MFSVGAYTCVVLSVLRFIRYLRNSTRSSIGKNSDTERDTLSTINTVNQYLWFSSLLPQNKTISWLVLNFLDYNRLISPEPKISIFKHFISCSTSDGSSSFDIGFSNFMRQCELFWYIVAIWILMLPVRTYDDVFPKIFVVDFIVNWSYMSILVVFSCLPQTFL